MAGGAVPVMVFVAEELSVALVTTHLPLSQVPRALTREGVAKAAREVAKMVWLLGRPTARVVVAALNPHAGEGGMFGGEELEVIEPGVRLASEQLKAMGVPARVDGPTGAETAFRKAFDGAYDAVVAMYHDQGTIPMKVRCFGRAVNVTAGLPIVRTSVDHGTAYDIAGTGTADAEAMLEAIQLGAKLARPAQTLPSPEGARHYGCPPVGRPANKETGLFQDQAGGARLGGMGKPSASCGPEEIRGLPVHVSHGQAAACPCHPPSLGSALTGSFSLAHAEALGERCKPSACLRTGGDPGLAPCNVSHGQAAACPCHPELQSWIGTHQQFLTSPELQSWVSLQAQCHLRTAEDPGLARARLSHGQGAACPCHPPSLGSALTIQWVTSTGRSPG